MEIVAVDLVNYVKCDVKLFYWKNNPNNQQPNSEGKDLGRTCVKKTSYVTHPFIVRKQKIASDIFTVAIYEF